jgi:acyl-CoA thioesterase-2
VSAEGTDVDDLIRDTVRALSVSQENGCFIGEAPNWFGPRLFGGFTLGQVLSAASETVDKSRRAHSLHAYFLRPALAGPLMRHEVGRVRDGGSASVRAVTTMQEDEPLLTTLCSFATDSERHQYELPMPRDVPNADTVTSTVGPGPWEIADVGATEPDAEGIRISTRRAWMRTAGRLPDDPSLHPCFLMFLSDMTWNANRPWDVESAPDFAAMTSLDHAIWFHRRARADEWLFYDLHSLVHAGGRGTIRGTFHNADRQIVASVVQEMRVR